MYHFKKVKKCGNTGNSRDVVRVQSFEYLERGESGRLKCVVVKWSIPSMKLHLEHWQY